MAVWLPIFSMLFFGFTVPKTSASDIVITGTVGGVVAGPTSSSSSHGSNSKKNNTKNSSTASAAPTLSLNPLVTNDADFVYITSEKSGQKIPQFLGSKPGFSGSTNIADALITLTFHYNDFTYQANLSADADGNFVWKAPEGFPDGYLTVEGKAESAEDANISATANLAFAVHSGQASTVWQEGGRSVIPVELYLFIDENNRTIQPGDQVLVSLKLTSLSENQGAFDVPIEFRILSADGQEVLRTEETVNVDGTSTYKKLFYTEADLPAGEYHVVARVAAHNYLSTATAGFSVGGARRLLVGSGAYINYTNPFFLIIAFALLFWTALYVEYVRYLRLRPGLRRVSERTLWSFIS